MQRFKSPEQAQRFLVDARHDLRSLQAAAPSDGGGRLSARSDEGVPDLATGDLRP